MNDNPQSQEPTDRENRPYSYDRWEERRRRREERWANRGSRFGAPWIGGAVLIILGIVFLLQNLGALSLDNWWALFILIPAAGAFGNAWRTYHNAGGRLSASARSSLIGGLILTVIAVVFLFNLNWGILGPALLILAGIGLFMNALLPH